MVGIEFSDTLYFEAYIIISIAKELFIIARVIEQQDKRYLKNHEYRSH